MTTSKNKPNATHQPERRPRETRYFEAVNSAKPFSRGFPKGDQGNVEGAAKAVARGYVRKAQGIDRTGEHEKVLWTVVAMPRIPGVAMVPFQVFKGDHTTRRNEK